MNKMKFLLLIATTIFTTIYCNAQERTNTVDVIFTKKSEKLISATGWQLAGGKWISHENIISEYPALLEDTSFYTNFYWIKSGVVNYNGAEYYVFYYEDLHGSYKYKEIKQDWEKYQFVDFFILNSKEYKRFKDSANAQGTKDVKITPSYIGGAASEKSLPASITTALNGIERSSLNKCIKFNVQQSKDGPVIRFDLLRYCDESNTLKESYFEVPQSAFTKLFTFISQEEIDKAAKKQAQEQSEKKNSIMNTWKTSDTLYAKDYKIVDKLHVINSFDWAVISSFISEGKTMYCIYFQRRNIIGNIVVSYLVLDQQKYTDLKATMDRKDGAMYQISSDLYNEKTSQISLQQEVYNTVNASYESSLKYCFSLEAKKKVDFVMPGICDINPDFNGKYAHYFECDIEAFNKLLKLP